MKTTTHSLVRSGYDIAVINVVTSDHYITTAHGLNSVSPTVILDFLPHNTMRSIVRHLSQYNATLVAVFDCDIIKAIIPKQVVFLQIAFYQFSLS